MKLYEYAVIFKGKKDKDGEWKEPPVVLVGPTPTVAADEAQVKIEAARAIPPTYAGRIDLVEVVVRPF